MNAEPISRDKRGRTYLHLVALLTISEIDIVLGKFEKIIYDLEVVEQDMKDYINIVDGCGRTVLHYVADFLWHSFVNPKCFPEKDKLFKMATQFGDVTARDFYARTPLHYAAMNFWNTERTNVYDLLVERGADVNVIDKFGETPHQLRASYQKFAQFLEYNKKLMQSWTEKMLSEWNQISVTRECLPTFTGFSAIGTVNSISVNEAHLNVYKKSQLTSFKTSHKQMFSTLSSAHRKEVVIVLLKEIKALIDNLVLAVESVDSRLKGHVLEVGSSYEGTKAGFPDE